MRHVLDAARNRDFARSGHNFLRRKVHRLQTRSALTIDRRARHFDRQSRQQSDHPANVEPLLAGLIRASPDHVFDFFWIDLRIFFEQATDTKRTKVVAANILVIALVLAGLANRHSDSIDDNNFAHVIFSGGSWIVDWIARPQIDLLNPYMILRRRSSARRKLS